MRLVSAGTTFNDVRIPFPHVRIAALAAQSTLEKLRGEHPTATPIIVGGDEDSLRMLFDERPAPSPEELIERSLQAMDRLFSWLMNAIFMTGSNCV